MVNFIMLYSRFTCINEIYLITDRAAQRPKSLTKSQKSSTEMDGADEQMLPKDEKNAIVESKLDMEEVKLGSNEKQNGDAKLDIGEYHQYKYDFP